jgi:hypothetical protein
MKRRTLLVTMVATAGSLMASTPALAQVSPPGCTANRFNVDIITDRNVFRVGDTIPFTVEISNVGAFGCDVSNITARFQYPGPDGTPSGPAITLTSARRFNIGTSTVSFGPYTHVAAINPGVPGLVARVSYADGLLHDPLHTVLNADKNISLVLTNPSLSIDKVGSIESGVAPQNVTYTYRVTNTSTTPVPMNQVSVTDDKCTSPTYTGGDDGNGLLTNGEVFTFSCAALHQAPGVYTNTAYACARSTVPGDETRPVCSPPDTWTVTLTPPPPPAPQVAVKPTTVAQAPCTLSTPKNLTVRAGQLNTIRVTVRNVDAGSSVKITLPGAKKAVTAKTNKNGLATLRVRPTKSGTAKIRVAECSKVENLKVKPARRVVAQNRPRVTG